MDNHSYHNNFVAFHISQRKPDWNYYGNIRMICVVLTGKGKLSSYVFGMVNTLLYAYIAYGAKYYGDVNAKSFVLCSHECGRLGDVEQAYEC